MPRMPAVSDTSPLSNLAIIGRLELMRQQFSDVLIPDAVALELEGLRDAGARALLKAAIDDGWLKVNSVPAGTPFPSAIRGLDAGETEALRLAIATEAKIVLMDEKEGRQCAANLGIRAVGVLGILIRARKLNVIPSLRDEIAQLRLDAGFFVDADLEARVLGMVNE